MKIILAPFFTGLLEYLNVLKQNVLKKSVLVILLGFQITYS